MPSLNAPVQALALRLELVDVEWSELARLLRDELVTPISLVDGTSKVLFYVNMNWRARKVSSSKFVDTLLAAGGLKGLASAMWSGGARTAKGLLL